MKRTGKTTKPSGAKALSVLLDMLSKINKGIHRDYEQLADAIETWELDSYLDEDGFPDIKKIDRSDISVQKVIGISMFSAFQHVHKQWHEVVDDAAEELGLKDEHEHGRKTKLEQELENLFDGKVKIINGTGKDMPPEVKELLDGIIDTITKKRKKKERE